MSTARRDILVAIEKAAQQDWEQKKINQFDAPLPGAAERPPKYLTTFPFPYMNGKLHLGHGFSLTKCEFISRFQRMQGKQSLWPFGLHVTGTPIAACAQKIRHEMEKYGNPPVFPSADEEAAKEAEEEAKRASTQPVNKFKSKRGKKGPSKPQWLIMQDMGIPQDEISKFADPMYWLEYFPPQAIEDLKVFGAHIDWRRSFITTDQNPFFDRFVQWQFRKLSAANLLKFDKRYCVYSPWDRQPCADHDRATGEGVLPQEYTVVKLIVQNPLDLEPFKPFADKIGDRAVVFPGATLRPETVIGQTNCWMSPEIMYQAFSVVNKAGKEEIFIMTSRAARNMVYQDFIVNGKQFEDTLEPLFEIPGELLIGIPLTAPHSPYKTIYSLPMNTITEAKGTGVVMSVPSDSPDDYINYFQLVSKPDYRVKLGIKDEWIVPFALVPIISIPEMGDIGAEFMCKKLKVQGPNDAIKLEEAKKACYQSGFYKGTMLTGPFAGMKVSDAKVKMQALLEEQDEAIRYYEPVRSVTSRSGDECIVARCEQWYLEYGEEHWCAAVRAHLERMNTFTTAVRNGFSETLSWLSSWPCSRTFGLGTKLPGDKTGTMIIDSLSDSTIYMAYYTIDHFFNERRDGSLSLTGTADNAYGLAPEMFTDAVFDHIFHGTGDAAAVAGAVGMPVQSLELMRNEFEYWYPVDIRCSAKDLIQNHLTMFLYNHAAIWPNNEAMWPRAIFCNGHILVDNMKMSKSLGNFISLREATDAYGADATRLCCADSGDTLDDANFVRETASGFIMKLTTLLEQAKENVDSDSPVRAAMRTGELNEFDRIFNNNMNTIITKTEQAYYNMQFRVALNTAFHEFTNEFSQYKLNCDDLNLHADLTRRYYEVLALLLTPLAPHFAEHMWSVILGNAGNIVTQSFPKPTEPLDYSLVVANRVMMDVVKEIRSQVTKNAKKRGPIEEVVVYTAPAYADWQVSTLEFLQASYKENNGSLPADIAKQVMASKPSWMRKELIPETMAFLNFVRNNVDKYGEQAMLSVPVIDDHQMLTSICHNICKLSAVPRVVILPASDESYGDTHAAARRKCRPGEPSVALPKA